MQALVNCRDQVASLQRDLSRSTAYKFIGLTKPKDSKRDLAQLETIPCGRVDSSRRLGVFLNNLEDPFPSSPRKRGLRTCFTGSCLSTTYCVFGSRLSSEKGTRERDEAFDMAEHSSIRKAEMVAKGTEKRPLC